MICFYVVDLTMVNFYESVLQHPNYYRQFTCDDTLITIFTCPLEAQLMKNKFAAIWTDYNYLFYVVDGRKIFHTVDGAQDIQKGSCIFVRKGALILEQLFDVGFCVVLFFIPDDFICTTLKHKLRLPSKNHVDHKQLIPIDTSDTLTTFFTSMSSYFGSGKEPDNALLELKFKELILTIADTGSNIELLAYFCSLLHEPRPLSLQRLMAENFCYNLKLEQFAILSNRSLSTFKRDFQEIFSTTPGKWLMEKRLLHAKNMLNNKNKSISDVAFESGFESLAHFSRSYKSRFGVTPSMSRE